MSVFIVGQGSWEVMVMCLSNTYIIYKKTIYI